MLFPIVFAVKGLIVAGKFLAAKGLFATAAAFVFKLAMIKGIAATVAGTLVVGAVIGGIHWTNKRYTLLQEALGALEREDYNQAIKKFAKIAISLHSIDVDELAEGVLACLEQSGCSIDQIQGVAHLLDQLSPQIEATMLAKQA